MTALKIRQVGNSKGVILPTEELNRMKLEVGDTVYLTHTSDGVRLTPYEPAFEEHMAIARRVMKKRRNALRELAK